MDMSLSKVCGSRWGAGSLGTLQSMGSQKSQTIELLNWLTDTTLIPTSCEWAHVVLYPASIFYYSFQNFELILIYFYCVVGLHCLCKLALGAASKYFSCGAWAFIAGLFTEPCGSGVEGSVAGMEFSSYSLPALELMDWVVVAHGLVVLGLWNLSWPWFFPTMSLVIRWIPKLPDHQRSPHWQFSFFNILIDV